ncbi:DUF924 family protein [Brunnivagina elsteri]|uniref:DUF924 domain-containing protein n=1 Tax=Brunnivagina elsteri CCALA 953 TaxID=987040 RepID=A0A2A2TEU9_9CYAN|nr:DUF924 family protein [Calothrix elsteri]PAX52317.1 hypothetical protein CK510_20010 [Calothrix elsteri CCALA 953]
MSNQFAILDFWFGIPTEPGYGKPKNVWFSQDSAFDSEIRSRFLQDYEQAAQGLLDEWKNSAETCLALILLLDQFPRNLFRHTPKAFATDDKALSAAQNAITKGFDRILLPVQRWFIYLPFEHSENLTDQRQSVDLFKQLSQYPDSSGAIAFAISHMEIIERFGRFPHRNAILGRSSTAQEQEFLQQPGNSF